MPILYEKYPQRPALIERLFNSILWCNYLFSSRIPPVIISQFGLTGLPVSTGAKAIVIFEKFKRLWKYYLFQACLAMLVIFVIVFAFGKEKVVIIASMGATAFICFAMPTSVSAQTKHVIGGHLVGLACGALFTLADQPYYVEYPLVVGLAIFLMVALDVQHPPAAGTALAAAINEVTLSGAVVIVISIIVLTQCRYYVRNLLKDLV